MTVLRVLVADDDVSDLLVLKRLLRDTTYAADIVRSASQALASLERHDYSAVIAGEDRLPDMTAAALLSHVERLQPEALRILLAPAEHTSALMADAQSGRYQLIPRPYFARPLVASLVDHAAKLAAPRTDDVTQRKVSPFLEAPPDDSAETPRPGRIAQRRVLLTLAELVEARAGHASGHGARVSALAGLLAAEAGLTGEAREAVDDAALVHDVGELALDENLLREPRPLTDGERLTIRRHAESSYLIVRRAALADGVLSAVRHHHERWQGGGYPDGLAGEAIPLGARIVAVADTWDALATDRPYRAAVPLDRCLTELGALAGTQLDPRLVALFVDKKLYDLIDWTDPPRPGVKLL